MISGARLGIWVGPVVPQPLAPHLLGCVQQVSVVTQDGARSGFQITLVAGRDAETGRDDVPGLLDQTFRIGNRVQLTATLNGAPHVLMDGIITTHTLAPGADANSGRLTVTGEDLTVLLDLVEVSLPFPGMSDALIAGLCLAPLIGFGAVPVVVPEPALIMPLPTEKIPHHNGTFLGILNDLAQRWGYTCYLTPGPQRGMSTVYWGPPIRAGIPQRALTWRMGSAGNLGSISFQHDGTKPKMVYGLVQESRTNAPVPVVGLPFTGQPMATVPSWVGNVPFVGVKRMEDDESGDVLAALWRATGEVFRSAKGSVTASGEVDVASYGSVLTARGLVDVRGVGLTMDGTWYVQSVTSTLTPGSWKQSFTLEREGTVALSRKVALV
ncbi:MAG: hypothetical protein IR158_03140 [Cellulomonas sp.]|jgi:hypothetical protein|uniref:hypothetical protein n=1 Tax=Cellulomonas sp. TaxID=40001 RepID=UPI0019F15D41|nr:hypothetical protein [Cellulomonas sp.]MBF0686750.1 hypothetical protein [Cellulomonas sp.]